MENLFANILNAKVALRMEYCNKYEIATFNQSAFIFSVNFTINYYLMAIELDLFSGTNYQATIRSYCNQLGWSIHDLNNLRAVLKFQASSGISQTVFIIRHENTLEFSCPSGVKFLNRDSVPGWISTFLLGQNSTYKLGF